MDRAATAVVADDEPLLAQSLVQELSKVWPQLTVVAIAENGTQAIEAIKDHKPDIAFLDIRMPGASGLEVAQAIAEDWPDDMLDGDNGKSVSEKPPLIVFVTAFDDYAVQAFESAAIDYLLKPVKSERLSHTVERLKRNLQDTSVPDIDQLGQQIRSLLGGGAVPAGSVDSPQQLRVVRANVGDTVRIIPIDEVILFESADKYVTVYTHEQEALIREPLRSLLEQLNTEQFVQIHRSTIVNMNMVEAAVRDDKGKVKLQLKGLSKQPVVSRLYKHLFQAM